MNVKLFQLFLYILGIKVVDVEGMIPLMIQIVIIGHLVSMHLQLILQVVDLELLGILILKLILKIVGPLARKLFSIYWIEKVTILSRHVPFLIIHSDRVGTQAWAVLAAKVEVVL